METSWLGGRVPLPNLEEMIEGALQSVAKPMGSNARFDYLLRGGFQVLLGGFLPHIKGKILLNTEAVAVSPARKIVTFGNGRTVTYDQLISTLPLPLLIRAIGDEAPGSVKAAAERLRHVSVRCVNLGIGREALTEKHWIYYPEETIFHRIFVQGNASPHCNPRAVSGSPARSPVHPTPPVLRWRRTDQALHRGLYSRGHDPGRGRDRYPGMAGTIRNSVGGAVQSGTCDVQ